MQKNIDEMSALVTGASEGLGRFLSKNFAKLGTKVCGIARNKKKLESLEQEILSVGGIFEGFISSVADYEKIEEIIGKVAKKYNGIDILVNNAAVGKWRVPLMDQNKDNIDEVINTNIKGLIYVTKHVAKHMIKKKRGFIFNISSTAGLRGNPKNIIYSTSKFAVNGFGEALSRQLLPDGINVVTINPGGIGTTFWDKQNSSDIYKSELLTEENIFNLISFILRQPENVFHKQVVVFPKYEFIKNW
jgi:3-oxoacyl-[acyl-carrier protein] reductase